MDESNAGDTRNCQYAQTAELDGNKNAYPQIQRSAWHGISTGTADGRLPIRRCTGTCYSALRDDWLLQKRGVSISPLCHRHRVDEHQLITKKQPNRGSIESQRSKHLETRHHVMMHKCVRTSSSTDAKINGTNGLHTPMRNASHMICTQCLQNNYETLSASGLVHFT